jgi:serine/threonine protein kinase
MARRACSLRCLGPSQSVAHSAPAVAWDLHAHPFFRGLPSRPPLYGTARHDQTHSYSEAFAANAIQQTAAALHHVHRCGLPCPAPFCGPSSAPPPPPPLTPARVCNTRRSVCPAGFARGGETLVHGSTLCFLHSCMCATPCSKGVCHLDIKPDNMLVSSSVTPAMAEGARWFPNIKLADFGMAGGCLRPCSCSLARQPPCSRAFVWDGAGHIFRPSCEGASRVCKAWLCRGFHAHVPCRSASPAQPTRPCAAPWGRCSTLPPRF